MLEIKKIRSLNDISEHKKHYFMSSSAPLDGMWHFGFVPMSTHYGFYEDNALVGYCCINEEGYMLQFYLSSAAKTEAKELFTLIAQKNSTAIDSVNGAFVSTAEPEYLSLCLDNSSSFKVNALMYRHINPIKNKKETGLELTLATQNQLSDFVEFAVNNIGAPEQWVTGYFGSLISRQELFGYWQDGLILASGECRLFDEYQTDYADLGMIVAQSERGQGIATGVLHSLVKSAVERDLTPICSTETANIGAQRAIRNAGLAPLNRIIQVDFDSE